MAINGYFNQEGRPAFPIGIYGHSIKWLVPVDVVFDTGFTCFLDLPLVYCLKAGLVLASTTQYTLADGSTSVTLLCYGTILMGKDSFVGLVSISHGKHALLGMEFLKKSGLKLEVDRGKDLVQLNKPIA